MVPTFFPMVDRSFLRIRRLLCWYTPISRSNYFAYFACFTACFYNGRNFICISVSYLMYGPYGSFAPTYDSSRATITKEQSDLLYSTYGDDTGIHYAKRLVLKITVMRKTSARLALASGVV